MKSLFITFSLLLSIVSFAQNEVNNALENVLISCKNKDANAIQGFQQLNQQYPNQRLVQYYLALSETVTSFETKDFSTKENLIQEAQLIIQQLEKHYPNDPEILNLKALNLSAQIMLNPMVNGMALMPDIQSIYAKSILLNQNNPRTILGKAEFNINTAKFIGGDSTNDCKAVKKALALFETEKPAKFEPNWGKDRAENLLINECKNH